MLLFLQGQEFPLVNPKTAGSGHLPILLLLLAVGPWSWRAVWALRKAVPKHCIRRRGKPVCPGTSTQHWQGACAITPAAASRRGKNREWFYSSWWHSLAGRVFEDGRNSQKSDFLQPSQCRCFACIHFLSILSSHSERRAQMSSLLHRPF